MKKLIIVISLDIDPFSMVGNAIGHMMVGIAPRMPLNGHPAIEIYSASKDKVRAFRNVAYALNHALGESKSLFSDFAHTTTKGTALDHQQETSKTREEEIHYYAACICAEEEAFLSINNLLHSTNFSKIISSGYERENRATPLNGSNCFRSFIGFKQENDFVEDCYQNRFTVVVSKGLNINDTLYVITKSILSLCQQMDEESLRLHCYSDADGTLHPGMSEYGLVVLQGRKTDTLLNLSDSLRENAQDNDLMIADHRENDIPLSVAFFSQTSLSKEITKKNISLWNMSC